MAIEELLLILSPNLGCPKIISLDEVRQKKAIDIVLAGQYGEFIHISKNIFKDVFKLVPSYRESNDSQKEIALEIIGDIEEITGWNRLFDFSNPDDTQRLINSEVHYNVLGEKTRYWLIRAIPADTGDLLKKGETGKLLPTLYDLVFTDKPDSKKINYHAVQFVETFNNGLNFIHLTDLHIAQRNDEILDEVLKKEKNEDKWLDSIKNFFKKKKEEIRNREDIKKEYKNFNDNFRMVVHKANEMAKRGELDFIVITGDIVDFAGLGWDEEISVAENNWKIFIDIVTGEENEKNKSFRSKGLNIAMFTSTGNHDWRLHPGSLLPYIVGEGEYKKFGLNKKEAENYNYKSFESSEYPSDKQPSDGHDSRALRRLKLDAIGEKTSIKIFSYLNKWVLGGLISLAGLADYYINVSLTALTVIFGIIPTLLALVFKYYLRNYTELLVDNPSHAEVKALRYYFKHINPYFDYAFSFGNNHFILMDTGADVAATGVQKLLDGKKADELKKVSLGDTLGMSPDSMAFDDRQAFYNWSQIVWLDKVLSCISTKDEKDKIFICVHAPPLNYDMDYKDKLNALRESKSQTFIEEEEPGKVLSIIYWLAKKMGRKKRDIDDILQKLGLKKENDKSLNLTYGTINHYLSQFFFLCRGLRENPHRRINPTQNSNLKKVDMVLSGHAHINVEFRIDVDRKKPESKVRIYHDKYSEYTKDFYDSKTFIVQTAACGPPGDDAGSPPYFRMIKVDKQNRITSFEHENLDTSVERERATKSVGVMQKYKL